LGERHREVLSKRNLFRGAQELDVGNGLFKITRVFRSNTPVRLQSSVSLQQVLHPHFSALGGLIANGRKTMRCKPASDCHCGGHKKRSK